MIKFKVSPLQPASHYFTPFQTPSLLQAATGNVWSLTPRVHDLGSWQRMIRQHRNTPPNSRQAATFLTHVEQHKMTCSILIRDQRLTNQLAANFNQNESV